MSDETTPAESMADRPTAAGSAVTLRVDNGTHSGPITRLATKPGANLFVTAGADKRIRAWNGPNPTLVRTMVGDIGPGDDGAIDAIAIHPNTPPAFVLVFAAVRRISSSDGAYSTDLRAFNAISGRLEAAIKMPRLVRDLAFVGGGRFLVAVDDENLSVYDLEREAGSEADSDAAEGDVAGGDDGSEEDVAELLVTSTPVSDQPFRLATAQRDGHDRIFCSSVFNSQPRILDFIDGELVEVPFATSAPLPHRPDQMATSDRFLAVANHDGGDLWIYDLDGNVIQAVSGAGGGGPAEMAFSRDGRLLIVGSKARSESVVTVHDTERGFAEVSRQEADDSALAVGFLDNGTAVSAGGSRFSLATWPARATGLRPSGDPEAEYEAHVLEGAGQTITDVGVSLPKVALGFGQSDEASGLSVRMDLERLALRPVDPSGAGDDEPGPEAYHRAQVDDGQRSLRMSEHDHNLILDPIGMPMTGHGRFAWDYAESYGLLDGDWAATGGRSGTVRVLRWDKQILKGRKLVGHTGPVLDLAADEEWLATGGRDQVLRLWYLPEATDAGLSEQPDDHANALEPALNLFVAGREWVIWSKSGYYAASAEGERFITFHINGGFDCRAWSFPADRFVERLYRPDIIRKVFETGSEAAALAELGLDPEPLRLDELLPPVVAIEQVYQLQPYFFAVEFSITDLASPTTRVWALLDGLMEWEHGPVADLDTYGEVPTLTAEFWLEPGPNELRLLAESESAKSIAVDLVVNVDDDGHLIDFTDPTGAPLPFDDSVDEQNFVSPATDPVVEVVLTEPLVTPVENFEGEPSVQLADAEVTARLDVEPSHSVRYIEATVDGEPVWKASVAAEAALSARANIKLPDGRGSVYVTEASEAGQHTVFSAHFGSTQVDEQRPVTRGFLERITPSPLPPIDEEPDPGPPSAFRVVKIPTDGTEGAKGTEQVRTGRPSRVQPQLFMLSVGVSKMKHKDQSVGDLKYAADDATEIARRFTADGDSLFESVHHWLLTDEQATKTNVESARDQLVAAVQARSQQKTDENLRARDVVLLFLSGHGVTRSGVEGEQSDFYLVTHDFLDADPANTGAMFADLVQPFFALHDFELVVLVDACRSAWAGLEFIRPVDPEELAKRLKAPSEQAQHFLCSTSGDQISWERALVYPYHKSRGKRVGHGLFTHAILKQMDEAQTVSIAGLANGIGEALYLWTINWSEAKLQEPTHYLYGGGKYLRLYRRR